MATPKKIKVVGRVVTKIVTKEVPVQVNVPVPGPERIVEKPVITEKLVDMSPTMQQVAGAINRLAEAQATTAEAIAAIPAVEVAPASFVPEIQVKNNQIRFKKIDGGWTDWLSTSANVAMSLPNQVGAVLKAFNPAINSTVDLQTTYLNSLRVSVEGATYTQSGSLFTEGIRDDISYKFSRDDGAAAIARLVNNNSVLGTVTHDANEGQAIFAVTTAANSICYYESDTNAIYEPGHQIRGGQTIELLTLPTGDAKIEWGWVKGMVLGNC